MHQSKDQLKSCSSPNFSAVSRGVLPIREIEFAELEGGCLVELVEDPNAPGSTLLAVYRKGKIHYTDRFRHNGQLFVPFRRKKDVFRAIRFPRTAQAYGNVTNLIAQVCHFISKAVDLGEAELAVLGHYVIATWVVDRLPLAPYLFLVGMPQSGKSTLLAILQMLCRRSLLTADVTSAALYQACDQLTPTLLMDEGGTGGNDRVLRHLLRMGSTRQLIALRRDRAYHVFGMKVFCSLEAPDDPALISRGIVIPMTETKRSDLLRPTDPDMQKLALDLPAKLFQFRLETYRKIRTQAIRGSERLRPRSRDLLITLASATGNNPSSIDFLVPFFQQRDLVNWESLTPDRSAVLAAFFLLAHRTFSPVTVGTVAESANKRLRQSGERQVLSERKVGSILTSFGFGRRQATNRGNAIPLFTEDIQRLHQLANTHRLNRASSLMILTCPLCREERNKGAW